MKRAPYILLWSSYLLASSVSVACQTETGMMPASKSKNPEAADRIRNEPESVWVEFIQLALEHKPLNLGQGFPDFAAPQHLIDALHNATDQRRGDKSLWLNHQYTRSFGHPRLVKALQTYYREFRAFDKLTNADEQLLITVGAYEALFVSVMAFVNPGDEVIIIDPAFDAYKPMVEMAQGKAVFVALQPDPAASSGLLGSGDFRLNMSEFRQKVGPKTKLLILNTPNNPLGKIYSLAELQEIAKICMEHNILVLADEVYEQLYHAPHEHISIASLPGMWDLTITIGSAGKTFSVTGWKLGWALGPSHLIRYGQLVHQTAVYTVATPLQEATARALELEMQMLRKPSAGQPAYWAKLRSDLLAKRDRMASILMRAKMRPILPQGGYFMLVDFSPLSKLYPEYQSQGERLQMGANSSNPETAFSNTNDYRFARWLSKAKKLQGIPGSAFYSAPSKHLARDLIRFCFIKDESTLERLEALLDGLAKDELGPSGGEPSRRAKL